MKITKEIKQYQCAGCIGGYPECNAEFDISGCNDHRSGHFVSRVGRIFPGFPKGFDRAGALSDINNGVFRPMVFASFPDFLDYQGIDKFNIPVWKHLDKNGNTLVRGISPRVNKPYLCAIKGNHLEKIDCTLITEKESEEMD